MFLPHELSPNVGRRLFLFVEAILVREVEHHSIRNCDAGIVVRVPIAICINQNDVFRLETLPSREDVQDRLLFAYCVYDFCFVRGRSPWTLVEIVLVASSFTCAPGHVSNTLCRELANVGVFKCIGYCVRHL